MAQTYSGLVSSERVRTSGVARWGPGRSAWLKVAGVMASSPVVTAIVAAAHRAEHIGKEAR
jgi:hypothetical protein